MKNLMNNAILDIANHGGLNTLKKVHSQSINSFGRKRNYVCLFDFREHQSEDFKESQNSFLVFSPEYIKDPVYLIIDKKYHEKLTYYNQVKNDINYDVFIYPTECWSAISIPIDWISKIIKLE